MNMLKSQVTHLILLMHLAGILIMNLIQLLIIIGYVNKNNYVKDEDEEDDNSSVIQNPFRDDIDN